MKINKAFYDSLMNFDSYYEHIKQLFDKGKTTGNNQSDAMLNYTKLILARMKRGLKAFTCTSELLNAAKNSSNKNWLVISEAWCGDAGNIIPMMATLANQTEGVTLKVMLRDEHPEVMQNYLTNGGASIPIFIAFDENFKDIEHWGPRPKPAQDMVMENKNNPTLSYEDFAISLQKWYQQDKTVTLQAELAIYLSNLD